MKETNKKNYGYCIFVKSPDMKRFMRLARDSEGLYMTRNKIFALVFWDKDKAEDIAQDLRNEPGMKDWQFEVRKAV